MKFGKNYWLLLTMVFFMACSSNPTGGGEGNEEIDDFIQSLQYNATELLNVQETGVDDVSREALDSDTTTTQVGNFQQVCFRTDYNLKKNFDKVAILRPTNGIVWPGALVKGNRSLMDGVPEPIGIGRGPLTLSIDLPGMGENGIVQVDDPDVATVQAGIDEALAWWNDNAYVDGWTNPSNSSFTVSSSYSSEQLSLDVGLNVSWATSDISSQFNFTSTETKNVVMAVYKQAFYTVNFVTPESPSSVFADDVTQDEVSRLISGDTAPAYVQSVTYGRIIMFRMETSNLEQNTYAEAALRYAAGGSVDLDLEAEYQRILRSSSIEVVTIGGNAAVASEATSAENAGDLLPIIQGENAVYSRNNPGVPIAYSVFYLKDNSLAKLGYTTEYTANECVQTQNKSTVKVTLQDFHVVEDCDTGPGDFYFSSWVSHGGGRVDTYRLGENNWDGAIELDKGEVHTMNYEIVFTVDLVENEEFSVNFYGREWDDPPFSSPQGDPDLDGVTGTTPHKFVGGTWTNIGATGVRSISIGSGNNCNVTMNYKVEIIQ